jgi:hypothetical protein
MEECSGLGYVVVDSTWVVKHGDLVIGDQRDSKSFFAQGMRKEMIRMDRDQNTWVRAS